MRLLLCPERVPVNRLRGWLIVSIIGRRGRALLVPALSSQRSLPGKSFKVQRFSLRHRRLAGILRASLPRWTVSCPSKEMTMLISASGVTEALMAFSWL